MFYTFRYRTGPLSNIVEGKYVADAPNLTFAVHEFKHFIRVNHTSQPLVVSYFYFVESPDGSYLGEFTESFYSKHFRRFQNV